jgi:hypothetical protein
LDIASTRNVEFAYIVAVEDLNHGLSRIMLQGLAKHLNDFCDLIFSTVRAKQPRTIGAWCGGYLLWEFREATIAPDIIFNNV